MSHRSESGAIPWRDWRNGVAPGDEGAIHLYRGGLVVPAEEVARLAASLSDDERERADRFRFGEHRRRFIVARGRVREILAAWRGVEPAEISFVYGPHGKPELVDGGDLRFSVSHSGDWLVVAVARGRRVGVDVETVREPTGLDRLARRCLSPGELAGYQALTAERRIGAFFRAWTRKEALLKATGAGLTIPMRSITVTLAPGDAARVVAWDEPGDWRLWSLDIADDVVGALASDGGDATVVHWQL